MLFAAIPGWGRLLALLGWVVGRQSWRRALWLLFPAIRGRGSLLPLVALVVPRQSCRKAQWVQFPANPGWGLLLALVGWSLANPGTVPCGSYSPPLLARACCWLWWGVPSPILAEGPMGAVPLKYLLVPAASVAWLDGCSPILAEGPVGAVP